jgi:DNA-binding winged helix-turn-helix (wHTH) protein/tetratricopeptide (TPR) repeat protein
VKQTKHVFFGDFKFDPLNQCVWRGATKLALTPKSFAVLDYLLANRSRLVTKEELLEQVWADSYVTDAVLKVCVREVRKLLNDNPARPQFIETLHRRGYRFIAVAHETPSLQPSTLPTSTSMLVGREEAQAKLETWLTRAMDGQPHIVFITGDPGTGKSSLAESFLQRVPDHALVARGHALEQYGSGEAYMPILEAFTTLCKKKDNTAALKALETHAPTWLAQMPSVTATMIGAALQREILGATRERMLREMAEAIEALTADVPLVLLLEDLHWSDKSTIDLISYLARRRASARLLLIGTYRPVELILSEHPLKAVKQELQLHRLCHDLPLDFLTHEDVGEYLRRRFPPNDFDPALVRLIHSRTDGNPLFMVAETEFLKNSGSIAQQMDDRWKLTIPLEQIEIEMPESLRELIERQISKLSPELQRLLQAASVAGMKFTGAVISFTAEFSATEAEEMSEGLTRRGLFIRRCDEQMPDGTFTTHYEFTHSLYQNVFYDMVPMGKRLRFHRSIGEGMEASYASQMPVGAAAELALHFEEGREYVRAALYLFMAAETASRRYAYREAVAYLMKARELIGRLEEDHRTDLALSVSEQLGLTRRSMGDMRHAANDFDAMVTLAQKANRQDVAVRAFLYKSSVLSWLDRNECLASAEHALQLSLQVKDQLLCAHVRGYCAYWRFLYTGWREEDALASQQAIEAAEQAGNKTLLSLHVGRHSYFQCMTSNYDDAIRTADRGIALAIEVGDFFDHAMTQFFKGWALLHSGRWEALLRLIDEAIHLTQRNEHYLWTTLFKLELAWLHQLCGSLSEAEMLCRNALDHVKQTGHAYTGIMATTLLGHVLLDQANVDGAMKCMQDLAASTSVQRVLMDWIWQMPLRLGLASAALRRGNYEDAAQNARVALNTAQQPQERTYIALSFALLAEISSEQGDLNAADTHIKPAVTLVEANELPLASERVYLTAAIIRQKRNDSRRAGEYLQRANKAREQLAHSLQSNPSLSESLLRARTETPSLRKRSRA